MNFKQEAMVGFGKIHQDIEIKYKKKKERKMAEKCLQLGQEWATIVSDGFTSSDFLKKGERTPLTKECKDYIKDNLSEEELSTFFPVLPILAQILLSFIINWVVKKIIENLFNDNE